MNIHGGESYCFGMFKPLFFSTKHQHKHKDIKTYALIFLLIIHHNHVPNWQNYFWLELFLLMIIITSNYNRYWYWLFFLLLVFLICTWYCCIHYMLHRCCRLKIYMITICFTTVVSSIIIYSFDWWCCWLSDPPNFVHILAYYALRKDHNPYSNVVPLW